MSAAGNDKFYTFELLDVTTGKHDASAQIRLDRVTTVLDVLAKPYLTGWAAKFQRELISVGVAEALSLGNSPTEVLDTLSDEDALHEWVLDSRLTPKDHTDDRSEEGTEAHAVLERLCTLHPVAPAKAYDEALELVKQGGYVGAVGRFYIEQMFDKAYILASEAKLFSLSLGVAGTVDLIAYRETNNTPGSVVRCTDLKTRKQGAMPYYDSDDYQTGAYQLLWNEDATRPPVQERSVLVAFPDGKYKETLVGSDPAIFLDCLALYRRLQAKGVSN